MPNSLSYDGGSRQRRKAGIGVLSLVVVEATGWSEATTMEVREGSSKAGMGRTKRLASGNKPGATSRRSGSTS